MTDEDDTQDLNDDLEIEDSPDTDDEETLGDDDDTVDDEGGDNVDDDDSGEDEDDDSGEDEDDDDEEGGRAQKRIRKLVKLRRDAEGEVARLKKELERTRRLSGDDGRAILSAAESSGILPGLMRPEEAKAFKALDDYPVVIERYEDWLDSHERGDDFELADGSAMSYAEVKGRVRKLKREQEDLMERFGERRKVLREKVRKILKLGLEAYRAGGKVKKAGKTETAHKAANRRQNEKPGGVKPRAKSKKPNWGDISGSKDLVTMLAQMEN